MRERNHQLSVQWELEKGAIDRTRTIKEEIEKTRPQLEEALRNQDYTRASELRYGKLANLEKELKEQESKLGEVQRGKGLLSERVDADLIAEIVARWTGIPVSRMLQSEMDKLLTMEDRLRERVIGQETALVAVADAVRRARAGLQDPNRPLGSFMFLGPTGVGKTELARALAEFLFDDEHAMIRLDMSEYMEKSSAARLTGAPPGFVGYEEGGQLTEAVRRRPYAVVLFDEVEKGHPDVFNLLLQILEDGRLTDSQGRTVDFKNTVIILTSNIGSQDIMNLTQTGHTQKDIRDSVMLALRGQFRPEFLNRIDEIIIFKPLSADQIGHIANIQLETVRKRLAERRIDLQITADAMLKLAEEGYDPVFGARPLKRTIQRLLLDPLALLVLDGQFTEGDAVVVDVADQAVVDDNGDVNPFIFRRMRAGQATDFLAASRS